MGLDTSHDCWHGPYSAFMRWRQAVCRAAGWGDLLEYEGYEDAYLKEKSNAEPKRFPVNDPLTILLSHSDCDGTIRWLDTIRLAKRLKQLRPALALQGTLYANYSHLEAAEIFISGLMRAHRRGQKVEFH